MRWSVGVIYWAYDCVTTFRLVGFPDFEFQIEPKIWLNLGTRSISDGRLIFEQASVSQIQQQQEIIEKWRIFYNRTRNKATRMCKKEKQEFLNSDFKKIRIIYAHFGPQ